MALAQLQDWTCPLPSSILCGSPGCRLMAALGDKHVAGFSKVMAAQAHNVVYLRSPWQSQGLGLQIDSAHSQQIMRLFYMAPSFYMYLLDGLAHLTHPFISNSTSLTKVLGPDLQRVVA